MPAGRELDQRIAAALEWTCLAECPQPCRHIPLYSSQPGAAMFLRSAMSRKGWESDDRITWMGWGDEDQHPWGYSIWFKRWINHVEFTLHSSIHDPDQAALAIARCALLALTEPEVGMLGSALQIEAAIKERKSRAKRK